MRRRVLLFVLLSVAILAITACRSRRQAPTPKTEPVVETQTQTAEPVRTTDDDFVQPKADPDVLSEDITEANRLAHERGWIRDAFFAFDASTLDASAEDALRQSATWLKAHPEFLLRVEGHCDDRGTEQYNLALGDRRAETAVEFLATLGVDRSRIETVSYGEARPFEEGSSEAAWAQNRRAHLVLSGRR